MKEDTEYSTPWKKVNITANIIVTAVPYKAPFLLPCIKEWWAYVIVTPEDNNNIVFNNVNSKGLTEEEKILLQIKIATKLTQDGILILTSEEDRSQLKNKEKVIKKCFKLLENALVVSKERKETKIPRAVKEKRLNAKKVMSVLKQNRKKPNF